MIDTDVTKHLIVGFTGWIKGRNRGSQVDLEGLGRESYSCPFCQV